MKSFLKIFFLWILCICFFPVCVHADSLYITVSINTCLPNYLTNASDGSANNFRYNYYFSDNNDIRATYARKSDNSIVFIILSENNFKYRNSSSSCPTSANNNSYHYVHDDYDFYYQIANNGAWSSKYGAISLGNDSVPYCGVDDYVYVSSGVDTSLEEVYDIIFNGVVPPEPINWGSLKDLSYTTAIAGGGSASVNNKDILSWDTLHDTNYNDISGEFVKIRVLKGSYKDSTKADLLTQVYNAIIQDTSSYNILGTYPVSQGKVSYEWSYIMNRLDYANIGLMLAHPEADYWIKKGWIYQAQLIADDGDYEGEWQTLYTGTSASAKASEVLINSTNYDIDVYQVIQVITEANNNTSITITYNDTDITIQNPNDGTEPTGGINLWDILKELVSGIFQIIGKLSDLVGGLIDGLFELLRSLFTPPESIEQTVNQTFELNINNYVAEDQTELHQLHLALEQFELDLKSIADDYSSGSIGSCIISWDSVTIDLSAFNAGNVTFINSGTYDFGSLFEDLIDGFGFTYSQYQFFVSGVIYICLIVFINHRIVGFLKRS